MESTETSRNQNMVSFSNDLFFKYCLSRDNPISQTLRKKLVALISGIHCQSLTVLNPEINQEHVGKKCIILDLNAVDENGQTIDIEIQMSGYTVTEQKRFQYYGARILVEQLNQGEEYYQLHRVYQYILINSDNDQLIDEYAFRNKDN